MIEAKEAALNLPNGISQSLPLNRSAGIQGLSWSAAIWLIESQEDVSMKM